MSSDEKSAIAEAENFIEEAQKIHENVEEEEKGEVPDELRAIKKDLSKFKEGDLSEERLRRIIQEMHQEEEEQESIIETEQSAIEEENQALQDLKKALGSVEKKHSNEEKAMNGLEDTLGELAQGVNKDNIKSAFGQVVNTVESMDTDIDEEAEMAKSLDFLSQDIAETVKEEENLFKEEKKESQLVQFGDQLFASIGNSEAEEKLQELEQGDEEEYSETIEELKETEQITELEEKEIVELNKQLKRSIKDAKEMINDIQELRSDIKGSPAENGKKMRKLDNLEAKLESDIKEAQQAREKLQEAKSITDEAESEEKKAEGAV